MTPCQTRGYGAFAGVLCDESLGVEQAVLLGSSGRRVEEEPFPQEETGDLERWLDLNA
jgi:hypothetical protein